MNDRSRRKRPRDASLLAKFVVDVATRQVEDCEPTPEKEGKDSAAVEFARVGGKKGGRARADKLTPKRRREIARNAANVRWGNIRS